MVVTNLTYLFAGEVDAHSTLPQQARIKLVGIAWHTGDDGITQWHGILDRPTLHILDLVSALLEPFAAGELLHARDINTVHTRAVIRQQGGQRSSHDLGSIHHADGVSVQPVPIRQDDVVDMQVLENLHDREGRARQDRLLFLTVRVEEADVLVHVEDIAVTQTLDVLGDVHDLLQVLVLSVVEDGVVDDNAVDGVVGVGGEDGLFDIVVGDFAAGVAETTAIIKLAEKVSLII